MEKTKKHFFSFWQNGIEKPEFELKRIYRQLAESGIAEVLSSGSLPATARAVRIAEDFGLKLQSWQMMLVNNQRVNLENHKDWYTVTRKGESTAEYPPYVEYYRWLCPNHPEVSAYLENVVETYCRIEGLSAFHLDYIRFADVILPIKCQRQYGLKQTEEESEYDTCYCRHCLDGFCDEYGYSILEQSNPVDDENWRRFRWDSLTRLVHKLKAVVHSYDKQITAAVFPTPLIARKLVRQNWQAWELDAYYPMMYNGFYDKDESWLAEVMHQCRQETDRPLHAGLYLPDFSAEQLQRAIEIVLAENPAGISFFDYNAASEEQLKVIKMLKKGR
jgi:uncharacterized lipoprotein YddW (UPF0748 family)